MILPGLIDNQINRYLSLTRAVWVQPKQVIPAFNVFITQVHLPAGVVQVVNGIGLSITQVTLTICLGGKNHRKSCNSLWSHVSAAGCCFTYPRK